MAIFSNDKAREEIILMVKNGDFTLFESIKKTEQNLLQNNKTAQVLVSLQDDTTFWLELVKTNHMSIQYLGSNLKKNKDFFLGAVKQDYRFLIFADFSLIKDRNFMLAISKINKEAMLYYSKWYRAQAAKKKEEAPNTW